MKDKDMPEPTPAMIACSDDVTRALSPLLTQHDSRLLFACLSAEVAYIGALLRTANIYKSEVVVRVLCETMVTALTLDVAPKVLYTDSEDTMGTKQ
jgi:hypothetical protein